MSAGILAVELWGAYATGSLALLSDAGHMLTDLSGLLLALLALRLASRPANKTASFGYQRYEVLAALANGVLLLGIVAFITIRAFDRLENPLPALDTPLILVVATLGLLANIVAALALRKDAGSNINAEGAWWNVVGDAVASAGVIAATLVVHWTGNVDWDTYISFVVAGIILAAAVKLLRRTGAILLEAVPDHLDLDQLKGRIETIEGVVNIHDLHVWTLTAGEHSLTMHVTIARERVLQFHEITKQIEAVLSREFGLDHATIQVEPEGDPVSDTFDPVGATR